MLWCGKRKKAIGKVCGENETSSAEKVRIKTFQKKRYSRHNDAGKGKPRWKYV